MTYANGKSKRTKNFGFFHFYPNVEEGSTVMVPVKPEGKGVTDFATQLLVSAVPIFAAVIFANILK